MGRIAATLAQMKACPQDQSVMQAINVSQALRNLFGPDGEYDETSQIGSAFGDDIWGKFTNYVKLREETRTKYFGLYWDAVTRETPFHIEDPTELLGVLAKLTANLKIYLKDVPNDDHLTDSNAYRLFRLWNRVVTITKDKGPFPWDDLRYWPDGKKIVDKCYKHLNKIKEVGGDKLTVLEKGKFTNNAAVELAVLLTMEENGKKVRDERFRKLLTDLDLTDIDFPGPDSNPTRPAPAPYTTPPPFPPIAPPTAPLTAPPIVHPIVHPIDPAVVIPTELIINPPTDSPSTVPPPVPIVEEATPEVLQPLNGENLSAPTSDPPEATPRAPTPPLQQRPVEHPPNTLQQKPPPDQKPPRKPLQKPQPPFEPSPRKPSQKPQPPIEPPPSKPPQPPFKDPPNGGNGTSGARRNRTPPGSPPPKELDDSNKTKPPPVNNAAKDNPDKLEDLGAPAQTPPTAPPAPPSQSQPPVAAKPPVETKPVINLSKPSVKKQASVLPTSKVGSVRKAPPNTSQEVSNAETDNSTAALSPPVLIGISVGGTLATLAAALGIAKLLRNSRKGRNSAKKSKGKPKNSSGISSANVIFSTKRGRKNKQRNGHGSTGTLALGGETWKQEHTDFFGGTTTRASRVDSAAFHDSIAPSAETGLASTLEGTAMSVAKIQDEHTSTTANILPEEALAETNQEKLAQDHAIELAPTEKHEH
eukprot:GHVT01075264.1.p1 GENE.GHVT01075264.1~~GHVT01075264.1.p1  ORF type:complete len:700 (+),score=104.58 GHVT01075264.1:218-2317(+)